LTGSRWQSSWPRRAPRALPLAAIHARLDQHLSLLTGGSRDLPGRQQTLRGAIDWSFDLLDQTRPPAV